MTVTRGIMRIAQQFDLSPSTSPPPSDTMALAISSKAAFACRGAAPLRRGMAVVRAGQINPDIKKDVEKVVDMLKADELPKKAVFCRCWRSKKFPMCDGSHVKHNTETSDNVGPLIIEKAA